MADGPIPSGPAISSANITTTTTTAAPHPPSTSAAPPSLLPFDNPSTNTTATATATATNSNNNLGPGPSLAPKRQRRPSVRLGDIGADPTYDHSHTHYRRPKASWRFHKDPSIAAKSSKTRPLTNLVNGVSSSDNYNNNINDDPLDESITYSDFTHKKPKSKKPTKRARTNWNPSSANGGLGLGIENDTLFRDEANNNNNNDNDADNDDYREFGPESPVRLEQSPVNSMDMTTGLQFWDRRQNRAGVSESRDHVETLNGAHNEEDEFRSNGVRDWLIGLGLGRYAPVFEIHEVDDEVLPMLTLEDLKDMGINAVGSRRKMYSAILKLRKGFS